MGALAAVFKALFSGAAGALVLGYLGIIKPLRFYGRLAVYIILIVICALLGFVEGLVLSLVGYRGLVQWITARTFYTCCRLLLGIRVQVRHKERMLSRPAVFISNHQTMMDILILGAMFPKWCSVTAKRSLQWYPFLGWFMVASKTMFIDRASRDSALKAFASARKSVLKDRQSVFMFPEGTRSNATKPVLLPFKKGAFHFAQQCQIPIVPFVVANYSNIWNVSRNIIEHGVIPIDVLEPIDTKGMTPEDVNGLVELTRERMLEAVERIGYASKQS